MFHCFRMNHVGHMILFGVCIITFVKCLESGDGAILIVSRQYIDISISKHFLQPGQMVKKWNINADPIPYLRTFRCKLKFIPNQMNRQLYHFTTVKFISIYMTYLQSIYTFQLKARGKMLSDFQVSSFQNQNFTPCDVCYLQKSSPYHFQLETFQFSLHPID